MSACSREFDLTAVFVREFDQLEKTVERLSTGPEVDSKVLADLTAERDELKRLLAAAVDSHREEVSRLTSKLKAASEWDSAGRERQTTEVRLAAEAVAAIKERLDREAAGRKGAEARLQELTDRLAAAEARLAEREKPVERQERIAPPPPPPAREPPEVGVLKEDLASALFELETARERIRTLRQENHCLRDELHSGGRPSNGVR